nr:glutathione S-transferase T3-like [Tanacetum cinerariifolium]
MSQNPNEQGYFTNLLNPNPSYQQENASNPSISSSQNSISSSSFQQNPGFDTQYAMPQPSPEQISRQQQEAFFNHQLNNQFQNLQHQKNTSFQNLQKQPEAFQQSQLQPRFKKPQPQPPKDNRRDKRVAKRATMDLVDDDEEEEQILQCARWTRDEEILLTQCWIETFENGQIGADRTDDSFWGQIMDDFNSGTTQGYRTRHMLTGKWTRINGDCQRVNAIYKHLEGKSGKNEADRIEAAKVTFAAQQPKGRKFQLEHA